QARRLAGVTPTGPDRLTGLAALGDTLGGGQQHPPVDVGALRPAADDRQTAASVHHLAHVGAVADRLCGGLPERLRLLCLGEGLEVLLRVRGDLVGPVLTGGDMAAVAV